MNVIVFCPRNFRTGGPEAVHQLAHVLRKKGVRARVFYFSGSEYAAIKAKEIIAPGARLQSECAAAQAESNLYPEYDVEIATEFLITEDTLIVLPEVIVDLAPKFIGCKVAIWWLSFDNALTALAKINLNQLRFGAVIHACQSKYAQGIIEKMLGCEAVTLSDYCSPKLHSVEFRNIDTRNCIVFNARPGKVIWSVLDLIGQLSRKINVEVVPVVKMDQSSLWRLMMQSYFYVDLASFPGKDRAPREAILLGTIPLVLDCAAAPEFQLPTPWRLESPTSEYLCNAVESLMKDYERHFALLPALREKLLQEPLVFDAEVDNFIEFANQF